MTDQRARSVDGGLTVTTIETPELGNRSYVIDDGTHAIVIDPQRDLDRVTAVDAVAEREVGLVLETHVHNDYVTGGFQLARSRGASYGVNAADPVDFERLGLDPGDELPVGGLTVEVLATPGHTDTHLSYLVSSGSGGASALFTGGSLLHGSVGRTDLLGADRALELARAQYRSVQALGALPDATQVFPTHGFGSFCSAGPAAAGSGAQTLGQLRLSNAALLAQDEEVFAKELVAGYDAYPSYYAHMAGLNRGGPDAIGPEEIAALSDEELIALLREGRLIDLRSGAEFARSHMAGSLSIPAGSQFATYTGWLLPWGSSIGLVGVDDQTLESARVDLARIGIEDVSGRPGPLPVVLPELPRRSVERVTFDALAAARVAGDRLVDVRRREEFEVDRIPGALNIPVHELESRLDEIPPGRVWTYCAGGFRAGTASSILARAERDVIHIDDTFTHAEELGLTENSPGGAAVGLFATNQDLEPARLRQAFGIFPSGVVAVAAVVDGVPLGLAASSFRSESLDPPLVSFSIAASSKTWPDLRRASRLGVSVLASHHGGLARQLAGNPATRFDDVAVRTSEAGALVIDEAIAHFDTTIYREVEAGDHVIVLLEIKAVAHPEVGSPLVFHRSAFGRLAENSLTLDVPA